MFQFENRKDLHYEFSAAPVLEVAIESDLPEALEVISYLIGNLYCGLVPNGLCGDGRKSSVYLNDIHICEYFAFTVVLDLSSAQNTLLPLLSKFNTFL